MLSMKPSYTSLVHRSGKGKNIVLLTSTTDGNGSLYATLDHLIHHVAPKLDAQLSVYSYDPLKTTTHSLRGAEIADIQHDFTYRLEQHVKTQGPIDQLLLSFHGVRGTGELVLTNNPKTGQRITVSESEIRQIDSSIAFDEKANIVLNYCNAGPEQIAQALSDAYGAPLEAPAHIYYGGFCAADGRIVLASKQNPTPHGDQIARNIAHPNGEEYLVFYPSRDELFDKKNNRVFNANALSTLIPTSHEEENMREVYDVFMRSGSLNTGEKLLQRGFTISDCKDASHFMDVHQYTPQKKSV